MFNKLIILILIFTINCSKKIFIESEPNEVSVYSDENLKLLGKTPLEVDEKDLKEGKILFKREGFINQKLELKTSFFANSKLKIFMNLKKNVYLATNPSNLEVYLDNKLLGTTPLLTFLPIGEHKLNLKLEDSKELFLKAIIPSENFLWQREFNTSNQEVVYEEKIFYVEADVCKPVGEIKKEIQYCIQGDCLNGCGTWVFDNPKHFRTGIWKDGRSNGLALEKWPGNDLLVGNFLDNRREGKGTYYFKNTNSKKLHLIDGIYSGNWKENSISGKGLFQYKSGERVEGIFDEYECLNCPKPLSLD